MLLNTGARLGPYEILAPLGAGGMGEVYKALDTVLGREIAIKILTRESGVDRDALKRFAQEARSASALNHPNIVTIYEVALESTPPYIAMEYVEGKDLRMIAGETSLTVRRMMNIGAQLAEGLAAAHERGIVHRDLKPENVLVTRDGLVKILDFGLAKLHFNSDEKHSTFVFESPKTKPGTVLGTVGYMSPEQAAGESIDYRSDQFALGAILYELVTRRRAFDRATVVDTLSAIMHEEPEPIAEHNPRVPAPFRWIIERLLSKEPGQRYASTHDLAREIRLLHDRLSHSGESELVPPRRFPRKAVIVTSTLAAAGVIAAIVAVGGFREPRAEAARSAALTLPAKSEATPVLAVLPFRSLSTADGAELLGSGFAEIVSARLSSVEGLQIVPPSDAGSADVSARELSRRLGVRYVVQGTIQREGDQLRITYTVVDAHRSRQIGADALSGSSREVFLLQDRVSEQVTKTLRLGLTLPASDAPEELADAASQTRYLQAIGYLQRYESEAAIDGAISILTAIASRNDSALASAALGRAYLYKFKLTRDQVWVERATAACERAIGFDSENADALVTLAELQLVRGSRDQAIATARKALAVRKEFPDALLVLGDAMSDNGDSAAAEKEYRLAIKKRPTFWGSHNRLGVLYLRTGRYAEAAESFQEVVRLTPDNYRGYSNLGGAYLQMGKYEQAARALNESVKLHPSPVAYSNLGTCEFLLGNYAAAARSFEQAVALRPKDVVLWANAGDAYRWTPSLREKAPSAYAKAIALAMDELKLNPNDATIWGTVALCHAKLGRRAEAEEAMQRATKLAPDDVVLQYQAAVVAAATLQDELAISRLRGAVSRGYNGAEARHDPEFLRFQSTPEFIQLTSAKPANTKGTQR